MEFTKLVKSELEGKYIDMLEGTTEGQHIAELSSCQDFKNNNRKYHDRLNQEKNAVNERILSIQKRRAKRLEEEQKRREEQERIARKEKVRLREEEEARRERERRVLAEKEAKKKMILKIAVPVAVILVIILSIVSGVSIKKAGYKKTYSSENITISAISKTESTSYDTFNRFVYVTKIKFSVSNASKKAVRWIAGEMVFYDGDEELGSGTITFRQEIGGKSTKEVTLTFEGSDEIYKQLYDTDFSRLKLTYKITTISFEDDMGEYDNAPVKTIKSA